MKAISGLLLAFAIVFSISSCDKDDDQMVTPDQLPTAGQTFLAEHFGSQEVISVKKDNDGAEGVEYDVRLDNGVDLTFDKDGNWDDVDAPNNASLPTTFILQPILDYVAAEYPNIGINGIDKGRQGFEVELTNNIDLIFDTEGNFVRIDQ